MYWVESYLGVRQEGHRLVCLKGMKCMSSIRNCGRCSEHGDMESIFILETLSLFWRHYLYFGDTSDALSD